MSEKLAENALFFWPALIILRTGRERESSPELLLSVQECLRRSVLRDEEESPPERLKSPALAHEVLNWLNKVWQRLNSVDASEILSRRQAMTSEIVRSSLPPEEQANLLTALDYLSRLASARKVAQSTRGPAAAMPFTQSHLMQAAYRKLTSLAATDLPIWLVGEKGTEVERLARLAHQLRGLPEDAFLFWTNSAAQRLDISGSESDLDDLVRDGAESTFFAPGMEEAPEEFRRRVYSHLVRDLNGKCSASIIAASRPTEYDEAVSNSSWAELSAFLSPSRIDVPPLRRRTEDIPALIRFLGSPRGSKDPSGRLTREALEELQAYHWPGNVEELEMVIAFAIRMRPSGLIRPEDLPDTVLSPLGLDKGTLETLEQIAVEGKFRALGTDEGRRCLASFLWEHTTGDFKAGDIQILFSMGRETARRLLLALESKGLVEPIKGAGQKRTTRYFCLRDKDKR